MPISFSPSFSKKLILLSFSLLFCNPGNAQTVSIKVFGATDKSDKLQTEAIQSAIDSCASLGGGTVLIPPGKYLSGTLELRSHVTLFLSAGATLLSSPNMADYKIFGNKARFIVAQNTEGVTIEGKGQIDGNGTAFWAEDFTPLERPVGWLFFQNSRHVSLKGIRLTNSPSHTIRFEDSRDVRVENITITNDARSPNTDGIDIVDSRDVIITGSRISTGDDAICLKSRRDTVQNVIVSHCILESDDAAIKFGTGSYVATSNCIFSDNIIRNSRYGIALFMLDGGVFEHNTFSDMTIETGGRHKYQYPIYVDIDKRTPESSYGNIRDINFRNLQIKSSGKILIAGSENCKIESVSLSELSFIQKEAVDFKTAKKPRGNKNYPSLATSNDYAPMPGMLTFGEIQQISIDRLYVSTDKESFSAKTAIDFINVDHLLFTESVFGLPNGEVNKLPHPQPNQKR